MQYKSVYEDYYYEDQNLTGLTYTIQDWDGNPIYTGRAYGENGVRVNVGKRVRDWLFNHIEDFRDADGETFEHPDALKVFSIVDQSNTVLGQWEVMYSFKPWRGQTEFLTARVNAHADPRQKLFFANGLPDDGSSSMDIDDGGPGDGPGKWEWEFHITTHDVGWEGGQETFPVSTNVDVSGLTVTTPDEVTLVTKGQNAWTFEFPNNEHGYPEDWEFTVTYNGETRTFYIHQDVLYDVRGEYLTVSPASNRIDLYATDPDISASIIFRVNKGEWDPQHLGTVTGHVSVTGLTTGDTVEFKSLKVYESERKDVIYFRNVGKVWGNILSLDYGDSFASHDSNPTDCKFNYEIMFSGTSVTDASLLVLPTGTLRNSCQSMFEGCTSLVRTPKKMMAKTLSAGYRKMFSGCTALVYGPEELPATSVVSDCYHSMFKGCSSLTRAPKRIKSVNRTNSCYSMFEGCSSLVTAPELVALNLGNACYSNMFRGCTSLANIQSQLPATTLKEDCYHSMFKGCTSLLAGPVLPARRLQRGCYEGMFYGCSALKRVDCKGVENEWGGSITFDYISAFYTLYWLADVSQTGDAYLSSVPNWEGQRGPTTVPSGWNIHYVY